MKRGLMLRLASAAVMTALAASLASAQESYPAKPVRFIAPYPPGGSSDVLARVIAQKLTEVPTMIESGIKEPLPTHWWGMSGPKGMPPAIVARLNSEIGRIIALPDVKQRYNDLGIMPMHSTPERMLETIRTEIPQMAKLLAAIGLKPK